jgi:large subunit ribosomal protein L25
VSNEEISLALAERKVVGKKVKQLRREGTVPAVIHDHGNDSKIVMAPALELTKVFQNAGKHHPVNLTIGKQKYLAIIKDVDFDPKKHKLRHVVFNAIKQDEKVETEVPLRIEGEIPAVKAGLMLITNLDTVEIEALPKDLVDELVVDGTSLAEIGDKITVSEIQVPDGVDILTDPEHPIATVEETKEQISESAEEETAEGEEGEAAEGDESSEGEAKEGSEDK